VIFVAREELCENAGKQAIIYFMVNNGIARKAKKGEQMLHYL